MRVIFFLLLTVSLYSIDYTERFEVEKLNRKALVKINNETHYNNICQIKRTNWMEDIKKYTGYYFSNNVVFLYICIGQEPILLFWSPSGEFVYRDDVTIKIKKTNYGYAVSVLAEIVLIIEIYN